MPRLLLICDSLIFSTRDSIVASFFNTLLVVDDIFMTQAIVIKLYI